jgi:hypothetical protein
MKRTRKIMAVAIAVAGIFSVQTASAVSVT